jgi:hypothetical protein
MALRRQRPREPAPVGAWSEGANLPGGIESMVPSKFARARRQRGRLAAGGANLLGMIESMVASKFAALLRRRVMAAVLPQPGPAFHPHANGRPPLRGAAET